MRGNSFLVCSACDEIGSAYCSACDKIVSVYAQHTHAIIFENDSKSNRTKVKILKKKFLGISQKKFDSAYALSPRKCSNIEILAKIEGKEANFFSKIYKGHIRI
jgi:hypothetical protein